MIENHVSQPLTQELTIPEIDNQQSLGSLALTDVERSSVASRILHDAELIKDGATINVEGELELKNEQIDRLYLKDIILPQEEEFMKTPSGEAIKKVGKQLNKISSFLHGELGHAREFEVGEKLMNQEDEKTLLESLNLNIDLDKFVSDRDKKFDPESYSMQILGRLRSYGYELLNVKYKMIQYPNIRLGSEVTVMRNGKNGAPNYADDGWKIFDVLCDGRLKVVSSDGKLSKSMSADALLELNS